VLVLKVPSSEGLFFLLSHIVAKVAPFVASKFLDRLWLRRYAYPHRVYFNKSSLGHFLQRHSFRVLSIRYLSEVPLHTIVARLRVDSSIPFWQVPLLVPIAAIINLLERIFKRTDALLVVACRE
jgi:hypothetical protein